MNYSFANLATIEHPQCLWNWVLAKQGLGDSMKSRSVLDAAHLSLGFHAARLPSPIATAAARIDINQPLTEVLGDLTVPDLVTIRCMRKTLHTLPVDLANAAHGATRHYRVRDVERLAVRSSVGADQLSALTDKIVGYLDSVGRQSHREIERAVTPTGRSPTPARIALKLLWEQGYVAYRNCSPAWNREIRTFDLADRIHPNFCPNMEREAATDNLIAAYFQRYGPATIKDAAWWSGISDGRIRQALGSQDVVELTLPWADSPFYMLGAELAAYRASDVQPTGICFLAHEDVALKAYFESRKRYLGNLPQRRAFNQIGEALPTILHDGQVVGLWKWDSAAAAVRYRQFPLGNRQSQIAVRTAANSMQFRLREHHSR